MTDDQQNLVSDGYAPAAHVDPNLVNPWGISFSATSPFWVSDNGTGVSTLYNGAGRDAGLVVTIPPPAAPRRHDRHADRPGLQRRRADFGGDLVHLRHRGRHDRRLERRRTTRRAEGGQLAPRAPSTRAWRIAQRQANFLYATNFNTGTIDVFDTHLHAAHCRPASPTRTSRPASPRSTSRTSAASSTSPTPSRTPPSTTTSPAPGTASSTSSTRRAHVHTPRHRQRRGRDGRALNSPWGLAAGPGQLRRLQQRPARRQLRRRPHQRLRPDHRRVPRPADGRQRQRRSSIDGLWGLAFGNGGTAATDQHAVLRRGHQRRGRTACSAASRPRRSRSWARMRCWRWASCRWPGWRGAAGPLARKESVNNIVLLGIVEAAFRVRHPAVPRRAQALPSEKIAVVIPAGGGGTRLWPRSRQETPKQFLDIVSERTMLQETTDRVRGLVPPERLYVITNARHVGAGPGAASGCPAGNIVGEPEGRDSAPAIGLMAAMLEKTLGPDTVMAVLPADHVILDDGQFRDILRAGRRGRRGRLPGDAGHPADRAGHGFGYIQSGEAIREDRGRAFRLSRPAVQGEAEDARSPSSTCATAATSGTPACSSRRCETLRDLYQDPPAADGGRASRGSWPRTARPTRRRVMAEVFPTLEKISVDYGIAEKADKVAVIPADIGWNDVGSWGRLAEVLTAERHETENIVDRPPHRRGHARLADLQPAPADRDHRHGRHHRDRHARRDPDLPQVALGGRQKDRGGAEGARAPAPAVGPSPGWLSSPPAPPEGSPRGRGLTEASLGSRAPGRRHSAAASGLVASPDPLPPREPSGAPVLGSASASRVRGRPG